jgi:integrase/recombinase XerD
MNAAEWYQRIKVRHASDPPRWYMVDIANAEIIISVKRYIDFLSAGHREESTQKNRCYCLRHIIVYLSSKNLTLADYAQNVTRQAEFSTWLADPYRTHTPKEILALDKQNINDKLKKSSQIQILVATRHFIQFESKRLKAVAERCTVTKISPTNSTEDDTDNGSLVLDPMLPLPKAEQNRPKTYSDELLSEMLLNCNSVRDKAMLNAFHHGGCRLGELLGMRLCDLDFGKCGIMITSRRDNPNGATLKTRDRGERFMILPYEVMAQIEVYLTSERATIVSHDMLWINLERRTPGLYGSPLKKSAVYSLFRRLKDKLSVDNLFPHMHRHTHATDLAKEDSDAGKKVDYGMIARRLGISVSVTIKTYVHLTDENYRSQYMNFADAMRKRKSTTNTGC